MIKNYKDRAEFLDGDFMEDVKNRCIEISYVIRINGKLNVVDVCTNSIYFGGTCHCLSHSPYRFTQIGENVIK